MQGAIRAGRWPFFEATILSAAGAFSSWWGISLQVLMLAAVVALVRVDWARVLRPR